MFDIFSLFKRNNNDNSNSSVAAKDRLKLVLVHDRSNCSPEMLEKIKAAFLKAIETFAEIDKEKFDIKISQTEDSNSGQAALEAIIPIKSLKRNSDRSTENSTIKKNVVRKRKR